MATGTTKKVWQSQAQTQLQQWLKDGTAKLTQLSMDPKVLRPDPERLQSRVETDPEHIRMLAEVLERGVELNPIVVFQEEGTGTYLMADGFHRHGAYKKHRRPSIPAYVVAGTIGDAVKFSASANLEFSKTPSMEDRKKAVRLMLDVPEFFEWSGKAIGQCCGLSVTVVREVKALHCAEKGIKYRTQRERLEKGLLEPRIKGVVVVNGRTRTKYEKTINGKSIYLGTKYDVAKERLASLQATRSAHANSEEDGPAKPLINLGIYLRRRGIDARSLSDIVGCGALPGYFISGGVIFVGIAKFDHSEVLRALGVIAMTRKIGVGEPITRTVVCRHESREPGFVSWIAARAAEPPDPIEFMTPEELVAEFGPKGDAGGSG